MSLWANALAMSMRRRSPLTHCTLDHDFTHRSTFFASLFSTLNYVAHITKRAAKTTTQTTRCSKRAKKSNEILRRELLLSPPKERGNGQCFHFCLFVCLSACLFSVCPLSTQKIWTNFFTGWTAMCGPPCALCFVARVPKLVLIMFCFTRCIVTACLQCNKEWYYYYYYYY